MRCLLLLSTLLAAPAAAEVKSASPNGLSIEHRVVVPVAPARLFASIGQVNRWWNPQHSYSGKAENLSMDLRAGGCFCEKLPNGGGVEHLRVVHVVPGKRVILTGALGPLLFEAVNGVLDLQVKPSGAGSELVVSYKASGFASGGADKLAPVVDQVLGEQVQRLAALR
jgi:uncharacterized protein YndB with AHSA1/START domain